MAEYGTVTTAEITSASSYRVKFQRLEFLELVRLAQPRAIYRVKNMHFFSFDGFAVYTYMCNDADFGGRKVIEAIEFSNTPWKK